VVEEANLSQTIFHLRQTLQEIEPGAESYIATAPGRGYRFAESVRREDTSPPTAAPIASATTAPVQPFAGQQQPPSPALAALLTRPALLALAIGASCAALAALLAWLPQRTPAAPFAPPPHSIAVMAFTNLSGDPGQEYFSDGLAEELIDSLGQMSALRVAARASSFSFKGKAATIGEIARQLNVAAVLEGSVRRDSKRLRITAELVDATTGYQFWSNHYDGDFGDTIKLQEQIAREVAASLQVTLLNSDRPLLDLGGTSNPKALDAYLRGLEFAYRNADGADQKALAAFDEAIALDHDYASAHVQRAFVLKDMVEWGPGTDPDSARRMLNDALAESETAISIAPGLGWAHDARAAALVDRFQFFDAAAEYDRARTLSPNDANIQMEYGLYQIYLGHFEPGIAAATRATAFDPVSSNMYLTLAGAYYLSRRYNDATQALRHSQQFGDYVASRGMGLTGFIAILLNDPAGAVRDCAAARDILEVQCLAVAYRKLGRPADSAAVLAKLQKIAGDRGAFNYAEIYAQWGQPTDALRWLETAYRLHDVGLALLKVEPLLDPIRPLPEFQDLERRMNFPP
jgi:TolB-like protein/Tfp pilus assembly protein PilF